MGIETVLKYFSSLSEQQIHQFSKLAALYQDWNKKINVVSRKDIDELYLRHVLHSLGIAKIQQFNPGAEILDVGTGGGFPVHPSRERQHPGCSRRRPPMPKPESRRVSPCVQETCSSRAPPSAFW